MITFTTVCNKSIKKGNVDLILLQDMLTNSEPDFVAVKFSFCCSIYWFILSVNYCRTNYQLRTTVHYRDVIIVAILATLPVSADIAI